MSVFDDELAEIAVLPDGWAGPGSHAPHPDTLANFRLVVSGGLPIPSPHVFAEAHGTVDVESGFGGVHLSVGRTRYSMYVSPANGPTEYFQGLVASFEMVRPQILALLAKL